MFPEPPDCRRSTYLAMVVSAKVGATPPSSCVKRRSFLFVMPA
jgi:hypothetical protein